MRLELRKVKERRWKSELMNLLYLFALLFLSILTVHVYKKFADDLFVQFFYAGETEGVITYAETMRRSAVRKNLEIEYINAEGKTRGFWTARTTKKDVGDKIKVRYCRQGGEAVADTLPELIFDIVMVVVIFVINLRFSSILFFAILWYKRCIILWYKRRIMRWRRKFRREKYIGRE